MTGNPEEAAEKIKGVGPMDKEAPELCGEGANVPCRTSTTEPNLRGCRRKKGNNNGWKRKELLTITKPSRVCFNLWD